MALCAIIYVPSLFWALGLDQNIFAEVGWLLLHGQKLYVNAWDVKPPNVFYIYALFEWIFGPRAFAVRISDYFFSLLACAAVYAATARQAPIISRSNATWIPPLAAILLIATLLSLGLADTAQTESYSLVFIIAASVLVQSPRIQGLKRTSTLLIFLAGVLLAFAAFFKTSNAVFLIAIAAEVWLYNRGRRKRAIVPLLAGFAAWSILQLGVLALRGSLVEYIHIAVGVIQYHPRVPDEFHLIAFPRAPWTYLDIWSLIALAAIAIAIKRRHRAFLRAVLSPLILFAAGIIAVLIQRKGWGYQYVVILPGLTRLCAISAAYVYNYFRIHAARAAKPATAMILLLTIFITPSARRRIRYTREAVQSITHHGEYLASLGARQSLYYPPCTDSLTQYIERHTSPADKIFIFGEEPGAYWHTNRQPASRFVYSLLFTSGVIPSADLIAMQDTLIENKPALIAIERYDTTSFRGYPETSQSLVESDTLYRPLKELLSASYKISDTVCEKFLIYVRR